MKKVRIAVVGAGLIGYRHIEEIRKNPECRLSSIVDPHPPARIAGLGDNAGLAAAGEVPLYASLGEMLARDRPDGVILATPNLLHADQAIECLAAGVTVFIEKPIAHTLAEGLRVVEDLPIVPITNTLQFHVRRAVGLGGRGGSTGRTCTS
jgi:predicted dehydrogenase